jgi:hypothetical protein
VCDLIFHVWLREDDVTYKRKCQKKKHVMFFFPSKFMELTSYCNTRVNLLTSKSTLNASGYSNRLQNKTPVTHAACGLVQKAAVPD